MNRSSFIPPAASGLVLMLFILFMFGHLWEKIDHIAAKDLLTLIGFMVTALLWLGSRWWELYTEDQRDLQKSLRALQAVHAEIGCNLDDFKRFIAETDILRIKRAVKGKKNLVPHIIDSRHTRFYEASIGDLRGVEAQTIRAIVVFYSEMEHNKTQIDSLLLESYRSISPAGRARIIEMIWETAEDAVEKGDEALATLSDAIRNLAAKLDGG